MAAAIKLLDHHTYARGHWKVHPVMSASTSAAFSTVNANPQLPIHPFGQGRIPALDGLRGIAILLVLLHHAVFLMPVRSATAKAFLAVGHLSWSGVDLFFVLSGFLIGGILLDARNSPRYFKTFYIRRAYRIFPLYGAVLALFLFRHLPFRLLPGSFGDHSPMAIPWYAYVTMTQNFWMAYIGWLGPRALIVTWSLAVEEQFYLTIPFLIRKASPKALLLVLLSVVVGAPLLRAFLFARGAFACYILMPCRADALCLGVLCALLVRHPAAWRFCLARRAILFWIVGILFAGMVFMSYQRYPQTSHFMVTVGYSWLALFYAGLLLTVLSGFVGPLQRVLCTPQLMGMGTLAYCLYLIHFPLSEAARRILELHASAGSPFVWVAGGILGTLLALGIAALSWRFFEKPLVRRGHAYHY